MKVKQTEEIMRDAGTVHLIGVGGVSMASLAQILKQMGYGVRGSDRSDSPILHRMGEMGIECHVGHDASLVEGADAVVYTAAIPKENPELVRARERGIPLLTRAELLGWLMRRYETRIGVAGTHGKSTTTSMLALILMDAGVDPTVLSGADLPEMGGAYRIGGRAHFLFEACEYQDSFLSFFPTTALIGNVELDHTDYFPSLTAMKRSFAAYAAIAALCVVNGDDENALDALKMNGEIGKTVTFGLGQGCDYRAADVETNGLGGAFTLIAYGREYGRIALSVPGMHNVYNALAASACAMENGIAFEAVRSGLSRFRGAARRFDFKGCLNGARVYDDYAHHPSEITATLTAARAMGKRVVCVFQPHTYARTYELFDGFVRALSMADDLILAPIYAAREANSYGVSSEQLAERIAAQGGRARAMGSFDEIATALCNEASGEDLILLMGAGDIVKLSGMLPLVK